MELLHFTIAPDFDPGRLQTRQDLHRTDEVVFGADRLPHDRSDYVATTDPSPIGQAVMSHIRHSIGGDVEDGTEVR